MSAFITVILDGHPVISVYTDRADEAVSRSRSERKLRREDLALDQSVLSQRKDPDQYPEITYLGNQYSKIKLYREWNLGRYTLPRLPQKADLPDDFLLEDISNLGLVLNNLEHQSGVRNLLLQKLKQFHESFTDISTKDSWGDRTDFPARGWAISARSRNAAFRRNLAIPQFVGNPLPSFSSTVGLY